MKSRRRAPSAVGRLLLLVTVATVVIVVWRLNALISLRPSRKDPILIESVKGTPVAHIPILPHVRHTAASLLDFGSGGEDFTAIMLKSVTQFLVDDRLVSHADGSPSTVVCELHNASESERCGKFFQRVRSTAAGEVGGNFLFSFVPLRRKLNKATAGPPLSIIHGADNVVQRLSEHAQKMKQTLLVQRGPLSPKINTTSILGAELCLTPVGGAHAVGEVTEADSVTDIRIVSVGILSRLLREHAAEVRAKKLATILTSAETVVVSLDHYESLQTDDDEEGDAAALNDLAMMMSVRDDARGFKCGSFAAVTADELGTPISGPVAIVLRCLASDNNGGNSRMNLRGCGDEESDVGDTRLPRICESSSPDNKLLLTSALKWGTKTAIFKGIRMRSKGDSQHAVAVKMFHAQQYALFTGFFDLVRHPLRSPLINYPTSSCLDRAREAVFQTQPFLLGKGGNLLAVMKKDGAAMPWAHRVELAIQILCIFSHLHRHPRGYFTFDDNHPEQYFVRSVTQTAPHGVNVTWLSLVMVDIDTLQRGQEIRGNGGGTGGSAVSIQCRCFYCHGKSDCLFINSVEGYKSCGQWDGENGDREAVAGTTPVSNGARDCKGDNDSWFVAQLLFLIGKGSVAWGSKSHGDVVRALRDGKIPSLQTSEPQYNALVEALFRKTVDDNTALEKYLVPLCKKHRCAFSTLHGYDAVRMCPSDYFAPFGYSSPLL